jgi:hypothetical protein
MTVRMTALEKGEHQPMMGVLLEKNLKVTETRTESLTAVIPATIQDAVLSMRKGVPKIQTVTDSMTVTMNALQSMEKDRTKDVPPGMQIQTVSQMTKTTATIQGVHKWILEDVPSILTMTASMTVRTTVPTSQVPGATTDVQNKEPHSAWVHS